jgi:8-oxo-dGTP diphosphatase
VRAWTVASGLIESEEGLLLVQNQRRNGRHDWSTPGGVIEVHEGETVLDGLTREVHEETGIMVTEWAGPVYEVEATAEGLGWQLRVEVHRAVLFEGSLRPADPDGIVVDARYVALDACADRLATNSRWVREPLGAWLGERWTSTRRYRYRVDGSTREQINVVLL